MLEYIQKKPGCLQLFGMTFVLLLFEHGSPTLRALPVSHLPVLGSFMAHIHIFPGCIMKDKNTILGHVAFETHGKQKKNAPQLISPDAYVEASRHKYPKGRQKCPKSREEHHLQWQYRSLCKTPVGSEVPLCCRCRRLGRRQ